MTTTIHKYTLHPTGTTMRLPKGSRVLSIQVQRDVLCLWVLLPKFFATVDREDRTFYVYGTGFNMPDDPGDYIGTVQMVDGALVWHVFETTRVETDAAIAAEGDKNGDA